MPDRETHSITAFSWGYWGWGNATPQLVEGVDAAKARLGFAPPLFVDVRFRRAVRAVGFSGNAFGELLGSGRYVHMSALGNKLIGESERSQMAIADPSAAFELLDHVSTAASEGRRVLFFCSCEHARNDQGTECHRTEVARLLRAASVDRGVALTTVEWPGGDPQELAVQTTPVLLRSIARGRVTLPLGDGFDLAQVAGLPWGSTVQASNGDQTVAFVSGPAKFTGGSWCLPVLRAFANALPDSDDAARWGAELRERRMLAPAGDALQLAGDSLAAACVYTIAHADKLKAIAASSGRSTLTERRAWVSAKTYLEQARADGLRLPIVFADAADCSRLLYWGTLTSIETAGNVTRYTLESLTALPGEHTPQELTLVKTGRKLAPDFIRPYALCVTPEWLRA